MINIVVANTTTTLSVANRTVTISVTGSDSAEGIRNKLQSLLGINRLDASAIKNLPSGGSDTAEGIRDKLQTLTGTDRLDSSAIKNLPTAAATWGAVTGTLSDQTDLQAALNGKENTITTLPIGKGGTGQTTASAALDALLPTKVADTTLATDGVIVYWTPLVDALIAPRTYFIRTDGNDSNNGLSDTAGGAFLTPLKAISTVPTVDTNGFDITLSFGPGTYTVNNTIDLKDAVGSGKIRITSTSSGAKATFSIGAGYIPVGSNPPGIFITEGRKWIIGDVILDNSTALQAHLLVGWTGGNLTVDGTTFGNLGSGTAANCHMIGFNSSTFAITNTTYFITGGHMVNTTAGTRHISLQASAAGLRFGGTVTITNTPRFNAFYSGSLGGSFIASGRTYSGAVATGCIKYVLSTNAQLDTNNNLSAIPGSIAGTIASGAQHF